MQFLLSKCRTNHQEVSESPGFSSMPIHLKHCLPYDHCQSGNLGTVAGASIGRPAFKKVHRVFLLAYVVKALKKTIFLYCTGIYDTLRRAHEIRLLMQICVLKRLRQTIWVMTCCTSLSINVSYKNGCVWQAESDSLQTFYGSGRRNMLCTNWHFLHSEKAPHAQCSGKYIRGIEWPELHEAAYVLTENYDDSDCLVSVVDT